jgi:ribosomal subunit interface protein
LKTNVSILHHDYPSGLRAHVEERLSGLERFYSKVVTMTARLERTRDDHRVELVANCGRGSVLVADVADDGIHKALDEAVDRMASQLRKLHGKLVDRRHGR